MGYDSNSIEQMFSDAVGLSLEDVVVDVEVVVVVEVTHVEIEP